MAGAGRAARADEGGDRVVLVTGGAGFIGSAVVGRLLAASGVGEVRVLDDRSSSDGSRLTGLPVVDHHASVLDAAALDAAAAGVDAIIHLAAQPSVAASVDDPVGTHAVNATGTLAVLEAARRHGGAHVVIASSAAVYGADPPLPTHEGLPPAPASPYAASKLAAEAYGQAHAAAYGLPVLALRFFNVYGPGQTAGHAYAAVVPSFVEAALTGRPLQVHGDGGQTRDFVHVDAVAAALADAVARRVTHAGPVNVAFGTRATVLEVADALEGALGRPLGRAHTAVRAGDVRHSQADDRLFRTLFPDVGAVPLAAGLASTVAWARARAGAPSGADGG